ncbi:MAG: YdcF family protein [Neomegalonema sp.]|nr:YdcF family protein [Neomegalonema sp.]
MKRLLKILAIIAVIGFVVVFGIVAGATGYFAMRGDKHVKPGQADVIIVLSAGVDRDGVDLDPFSQARVRLGVKLWKAGAAPRLLMSGGLDPRTSQHIAWEMQRLAAELGVPEGFILVEGNSISTFENARYTLDVARQEKWSKAIVVTDDFHLLRAWTLFEFWRESDDVKIVALAASDGRSKAGLMRASWTMVRETLAVPFNVMKMAGQLALDTVGMGGRGAIR